MIVQQETLVDKIVKSFIEAAAQGQFVAGDKLPIHEELQKMFGVSRNTMREALQRLESLGVVSIRQGDGTYLNNVDAQTGLDRLYPLLRMNNLELGELTEARKILETQTAYLAALRASEEDLLGMAELLEQMGENLDNNTVYADLDKQLHLLIAKGSKNGILYKFVAFISDLMKAQQGEIARRPRVAAISYQYHIKLVQALTDGDARKAADLMTEHLENAYQRLQNDTGEQGGNQ